MAAVVSRRTVRAARISHPTRKTATRLDLRAESRATRPIIQEQTTDASPHACLAPLCTRPPRSLPLQREGAKAALLQLPRSASAHAGVPETRECRSEQVGSQ